MKNAALKRLVEKEVNNYIKFLDDRSNIFYLATNSAGKLVKETNFDTLIKKCLDVLAQKSELIVTRMINGKVGKVMKVTESNLKPNLRGALNNLKNQSATTNKNKQEKLAKNKEKQVKEAQSSMTGAPAEKGVKGSRSGKYYSEQMEREKRQTENAQASRLPARGKKTSETTALGLKAIKPNNEFSALRASERKRQVPTEYARRAHERELNAQKELERQNEKEAARQSRALSIGNKKAKAYAEKEAEKIVNKALTSKSTMDPIWMKVSNLKALNPNIARLKKQASDYYKKIVAREKEQSYKEKHPAKAPALKRSFPNAYLGTKKKPLSPEERAEKINKEREAQRAKAKQSGKVEPKTEYKYKPYEKPKSKEQQREETRRMTEAFMKKGGTVKKSKDTYAMVLRKRRNRREDARISRLNDMMFYQYIMKPRKYCDVLPAVFTGLVIQLIPLIKMAIMSQVAGMIAKRLLNHCMLAMKNGGADTVTESAINLIKSDLQAFVVQLKKEKSFLLSKVMPIADKIKALR